MIREGIPDLTPDAANLLWKNYGEKNFKRWHSRWGVSRNGVPKLLECQVCFERFLSEYGLARHDADKVLFRQRFLDHFQPHVKPTYRDLEKWATEGDVNRRSHFSKVAAFAWPEEFLPYDTYSLGGLIRLKSNNEEFKKFPSPRDNLESFGQMIEKARYVFGSRIQEIDASIGIQKKPTRTGSLIFT